MFAICISPLIILYNDRELCLKYAQKEEICVSIKLSMCLTANEFICLQHMTCKYTLYTPQETLNIMSLLSRTL